MIRAANLRLERPVSGSERPSRGSGGQLEGLGSQPGDLGGRKTWKQET